MTYEVSGRPLYDAYVAWGRGLGRRLGKHADKWASLGWRKYPRKWRNRT